MSTEAIGPIAFTGGQPFIVQNWPNGTWRWAVIANLSPMPLLIGGEQWLNPNVADLFPMTASTSRFDINPIGASTGQLLVTLFDPDEPINPAAWPQSATGGALTFRPAVLAKKLTDPGSVVTNSFALNCDATWRALRVVPQGPSGLVINSATLQVVGATSGQVYFGTVVGTTPTSLQIWPTGPNGQLAAPISFPISPAVDPVLNVTVAYVGGHATNPFIGFEAEFDPATVIAQGDPLAGIGTQQLPPVIVQTKLHSFTTASTIAMTAGINNAVAVGTLNVGIWLRNDSNGRVWITGPSQSSFGAGTGIPLDPKGRFFTDEWSGGFNVFPEVSGNLRVVLVAT